MATPHTIPSIIVPNGSAITAANGNKLYITAILIAGDVEIDGVTATGAGPIALPSPIICNSFTPAAGGQVAYFEK